MDKCCNTEEKSNKTKTSNSTKRAEGFSFDIILHGSLLVIILSFCLHFLLQYFGDFPFDTKSLNIFIDTQIELFSRMWWGVLLGIFFVGIMSKIPKEYFQAALGKGGNFSGLLRAAIAGLFLDLCSHGILLVGAKLYERGVSTAQIMTFLIASPWNSFSLTIILCALIGIKWTLIYILGSLGIALLTGVLFNALVKKGHLVPNPNAKEISSEKIHIIQDAKKRLKEFKPNKRFFADILTKSFAESSLIIKWLLLGVLIASAIRSFIPAETFSMWFGPTVLGLLFTLLATTIIEVCSEGSAPIASELTVQANAPGNGFTFLMAGVSTDYTEIMVIREFSKSWKTAFALPLLTIPQVLILGYVMNSLSF